MVSAPIFYILAISISLIRSCSGSIMLLPTMEVPPDAFGSPDNWGFLDSDILAFDPPTSAPQKGFIVLSYLKKLGPDVPVDSSVNCIKMNTRPYA